MLPLRAVSERAFTASRELDSTLPKVCDIYLANRGPCPLVSRRQWGLLTIRFGGLSIVFVPYCITSNKRPTTSRSSFRVSEERPPFSPASPRGGVDCGPRSEVRPSRRTVETAYLVAHNLRTTLAAVVAGYGGLHSSSHSVIAVGRALEEAGEARAREQDASRCAVARVRRRVVARRGGVHGRAAPQGAGGHPE